MGNAGYRFFPRYKEAREDYYDNFRWLGKLKEEYPVLNIAIKHHSGDYDISRDKEELRITKGIRYIDNKLNTYDFISRAKMCVSYCSTMILELNGMPNLGKYIYYKRHKRLLFNSTCKGGVDYTKYNIPAYYLDPHRRNRQFCMNINDVSIHNCEGCKGKDLEIFDNLRLTSYEEFRSKVKEILDIYL